MREYVTTKQEINKNSLPYNLYQKAKKFGIWNPVDIDFSQDKEDWKKLSEEQQLEVLTQFAQFIGGEEAVTQDILPMIMAVSKKGWFEEETYLTTFLFEEAKHAEFFSLFLEEIGVTDDLSHLLSPGHHKLFDETLPTVMNKLLDDQSPEAMIDAAVTYNIFAEGVLAETGYWFFYEALSKANLFPGFISGIRNVKRDEGRHIGFGTFLIQRLISENPELELFERVQQRLQELLPIAIMLTERPEGQKVTSLGIEEGKAMEFAMKQLQARMTVLSRAKGKTLEEIYNTEVIFEEAEAEV
jgi:ribonucleoside-diphosphate reductase beta chain